MNVFTNAIDYFFRGGPCMWPLLACSFAAIVIGVERLLLYRTVFSGTKFVEEFRVLMHELKTDEALELAKNSKGDAAQLAVDMLAIQDEHLGNRYEAMTYGKTDRCIESWERHLDYLEVIIALSPMLGLLGTITGMISSLNALNDRMSNPLAVTAGIGEALITTVFGLIISMMGVCIHSYLAGKLKRGSLDINQVADILANIYALRHHLNK